MIKLNKMEQNEYNAFIVAVVPSLLPGTYHFRDFFTNRVTSARIGRKFYEDVVNGIYPHISLVGTKASEGYICSWVNTWFLIMYLMATQTSSHLF